MNRSVKNRVYVYPLIVALVLGLLLLIQFQASRSESDSLQSQIEEGLQSLLLEQQSYIELVSEDPSYLYVGNSASIRFPTFLFSKNQLLHWNTSTVDFNFEHLAELDTLGLLNVNQSDFLYRKKILTSSSDRLILISLVPLVTDYRISNQYLNRTSNPNIFPNEVFVSELNSEGFVPVKFQEEILFYARSVSDQVEKGVHQSLALFYVFGIVIALLLSLYLFSISYIARSKATFGFLIMLSGIATLQLVFLLFGFPDQYLGGALFDSSVYISSVLGSTLGGLFINSLCILILVSYAMKYVSSVSIENQSAFVKVVLYIFGYSVALGFSLMVLDLIFNSQINFDLNSSIDFDAVRVLAFAIICLNSVVGFMILHIIYLLIAANKPTGYKLFFTLTISGLLVGGTLSLLLGLPFLWVCILWFLYFLVLYFNDLPLLASKFKFGSLIYYLIGILFFSTLGAITIQHGIASKEIVDKQKFSTHLLIDRDIEGEYLLNEISTKIRSDMVLNSKLITPRVPVSQVKERVNQLFVDDYFAGYNLTVRIFDKDGLELVTTLGIVHYDDLKERFRSPAFMTDYPNIYYEGNFLSTGRKRYLSFVELERYGNQTGYIVLELHQKKQASRSVYPELLLNQSIEKASAYDYAVYDDQILVHSVGGFNYKADFQPNWVDYYRTFEGGIKAKNHHHLGVKSGKRSIIITSQLRPVWFALSNFSFLFLILLLLSFSIGIVFYLSSIRQSWSFNFSTKILLYLAVAFAIPLFLVGAAILNTLNESYKAEIDKSFQKQTIAISENFVELITKFYNNELSRDAISSEIIKISKSARADINLFNREGRLIATSQPKVIESKLISPNINPKALYQLEEQNKDKLILDETLGKLSYKSAYVAIRSYDSGSLLGIVSSPFFSSKNHLKRQQSEVFNNIITISTLIFIISCGLSYLAVRRLTSPLKLIASKLKSTGLSEENPPLEWTNDDEIGTLVNEYNSMLEKLAYSKDELARNEKEAAWREMAKQVAHEIKNPLTPMKLTLQHLDRTIDKSDQGRKSLSTLLSQIDTLDQIVTSFSHFAKMPDPKNENFDVIMELDKIIALHPDKKIECRKEVDKAMIMADRKLFGRIFNNIVLNAFQAMSKLNEPKLTINILCENQNVLISFSDEGIGIPQEIRDKVFIPNFSTKDAGSGIGLAVAKRGIEHAGGRIWFEANSQAGTTFFIELPLRKDE